MRISAPVVRAYCAVLDENGLRAAAEQPRPADPPVGGITQEQTDAHFVHSFDGSTARVQLTIIDPFDGIPITSAELIRFLSGGQLSLADIPCGAGAGAAGMLGSIFELRRAQKLPRVPLYVHVIGGEISSPARAYAERIFGHLVSELQTQAIFLTYELCEWDVLSDVSTTDLIRRIIRSEFAQSQTLVAICNFNAFLEREGKKKAAQPQLEEIFRYCSGRTNGAVWIEPQMNSATKGLFPWLLNLFKGWGRFLRLPSGLQEHESSQCPFIIPLRDPEIANARVTVVPIDLTRAA
jgi:hypothetical protein